MKITTAALLLLASASPAFAESGARQDSSSILIWAFLGFCFLIVTAQVIPVISNFLSSTAPDALEDEAEELSTVTE